MLESESQWTKVAHTKIFTQVSDHTVLGMGRGLL